MVGTIYDMTHPVKSIFS